MRLYDPTQRLTTVQTSILVGSLLGDACVVRNRGPQGNARASFVHGRDQAFYLDWKYDHLADWCNSPPVGPFPTSYGGETFRFQTRSHPVFTELASLVRPGGGAKRITSSLLEQVDHLALAVWFMDDGSWSPTGGQIATHGFPLADVKLSVAWLRGLGVDCSMSADGRGKGCYVHVRLAGMQALREMVGDFVLPEFAYKLHGPSARMAVPPVPARFRSPGSRLSPCVVCGRPFVPIRSAKTCGPECSHANFRRLVADGKRRARGDSPPHQGIPSGRPAEIEAIVARWAARRNQVDPPTSY